MKYRDYNDYELLSYIEENNESANEIIFEKYKPLIINTSKNVYKYCKNTGLELNDLIQEGMLGLNRAINSYDENKNIKFYSYARTCIENAIASLVTQTRRQKNRVLNESISIEYDDEEKYKTDIIFKDNSLNPEIQILDYENQKELIEKVKKVLTNLELQVFELKMASFSYKEIAKILNKEPKTIDNAIQRIRMKVKNLLNY